MFVLFKLVFCLINFIGSYVDVAVIENKKVDLVLEGTEIEIDRNILRS